MRTKSYQDPGWWLAQGIFVGVSATMLFAVLYLLGGAGLYRILADSCGVLAASCGIILAFLVKAGRVPQV